MFGYKTFEVSVFNHQTGTEIQFKKVDLVVLDDSIYVDDGYDLLVAKMSTVETDVDQRFVGDCEDDNIQLSTFESIFNVNSYLLI
ncbi:hypothetical protein Hanom_Chr01g00060781 [Helianthus anomalus]